MFEPSSTTSSNNTSFEQSLFEDAAAANQNIPKLTVSNLPQGNFTWSPKSSDSGETETDDISHQHEGILNAAAITSAQQNAAARMNAVHEENSFFNLPAHPSDLQELEQQQPSSVFEFNRSLRSSPLGEEFVPGSSYPPSTASQFKPSSYESSHFPSELGYPEPPRVSGMTVTPPGVDPKLHERFLQHQMLMQQRKIYGDHESAKPVSPSSLMRSNAALAQPGYPGSFPATQPLGAYPDPYANRFAVPHGVPPRMVPGQPSLPHAIPPKFSSYGATGAVPSLPIRGAIPPVDYTSHRLSAIPGAIPGVIPGAMPGMPGAIPGAIPSVYGASPYAHIAPPPPVNSVNSRIYQVQFKCSNRFFTLGMHASPTIAVGDFVVVEADRGEDIGIVTDVMPMKTFIERRIYYKSASDDDDNVIGRIIRPASPAERQLLPEKYRDEEGVLQLCRELGYGTYRLPMIIHDVDYQFDRHKLTIFYSSESRIDFREFVRDLFSAYKARIWMKKLNIGKPLRLEQWAAMGLATGMQFSPERPEGH